MPKTARLPVLVGAAALRQRSEDPRDAREPIALMADALRAAAADAGSSSLLGAANAIYVPRGFWAYRDPGRLLAEQLGASAACSELFEIGVLQTSLFAQAARAISAGEVDVVLIAGGEARYRTQRAQIEGVTLRETEQRDDCAPDRIHRPHADVLPPLEIERGLQLPVSQYAVIENALRAAAGQELDAHRNEIDVLWSGMSAAAAANPSAWSRELKTPASLAPGPKNRMLAFPYTKLHNSQWNVDQAAGFMLCAEEVAERHGVPRERRIYLHAATESNHMLPLSRRAELSRCPGFRLVGQRAGELAGVDPNAIEHRELYSCFPSAVRVQLREIGLDTIRPVTWTGGMAFHGGPLNNYVLQCAARMAEILRGDPGSCALLTAVSGILTKQGATIWSTRVPERGFQFADLRNETERATPAVELCDAAIGDAQIASYTVLFEHGDPARAIALCDLPSGERAIAVSADRDLARDLTLREGCGLPARLLPKAEFAIA
jgi:acetyl-CoA C-acetyltransferase